MSRSLQRSAYAVDISLVDSCCIGYLGASNVYIPRRIRGKNGAVPGSQGARQSVRRSAAIRSNTSAAIRPNPSYLAFLTRKLLSSIAPIGGGGRLGCHLKYRVPRFFIPSALCLLFGGGVGEFSGLSSSACFASSVESPHYLCLFGGLSLLAPSIGSVTSSVYSGCAGGGTGGRARRQRKGMGSSGGRSISGDSRSGDEGRVPRVTASVDICVVFSAAGCWAPPALPSVWLICPHVRSQLARRSPRMLRVEAWPAFPPWLPADHSSVWGIPWLDIDTLIIKAR